MIGHAFRTMCVRVCVCVYERERKRDRMKLLVHKECRMYRKNVEEILKF